MKKLSILFTTLAAVAAASFVSCDEPVDPVCTVDLSIKLDGAPTRVTRAVEAGAQTTGVSIQTGSNSLIFVADADGAIVQTVEVSNDATSENGQSLPNPVAETSQIYVLANIPDDQIAAFKAFRTLSAVMQATSTIESQEGRFNTNPAMANKSGAVPATSVGSSGVLSVTVEPLYARVEIASIEVKADAAGNEITDFTVTGVFVDNYYESFTWTGGAAGEAVSKLGSFDEDPAATVLDAWEADYMKDEGSWAANESQKAIPDGGANNVWGYNVATGDQVPVVIVRIEGITYEDASGTALTAGGARYLTVTGFKDVSAISKGEVYRLGGSKPFAFSFSNLGTKPYEEATAMTVHVDVEQWNVVDYEPVFNND